MGFDIIIAVDLIAPPEKFDTTPLALPDLMNTLYGIQMSRDHHNLADVVLFPLPADVSMMDFGKGPEIYALAKRERERFTALLEPIREKIASENSVSTEFDRVSGTYKDIPPLTPQRIIIKGALPRDYSYIERTFSRLLMGKALEEVNVKAFLENVYATGNYRKAILKNGDQDGFSSGSRISI
jgi:hypothetical protein